MNELLLILIQGKYTPLINVLYNYLFQRTHCLYLLGGADLISIVNKRNIMKMYN